MDYEPKARAVSSRRVCDYLAKTKAAPYGCLNEAVVELTSDLPAFHASHLCEKHFAKEKALGIRPFVKVRTLVGSKEASEEGEFKQ